MMMMAAMATAAAHAAAGAEGTKRTITIYMIDHRQDSNYPLNLAEQCASRIFATAGLDVEWRSGNPAETPSATGLTFVIELVDRTPATNHKGALAYALPYEGVHITLFFDRIAAMDKQLPDILLAHVLTHEITHMLEGVSRHSPTGVMKATFTRADVMAMRSKPMTFAPEDVMLIDLGIRHREWMEHAAAGGAARADEK
jgi:hypothetical protein